MTSEIKSIIEHICISEGMECSKVILFGSRARGDFDPLSDYDILIVVDGDITRHCKRTLSRKVREALAKKLIGADIIVKSTEEIKYYADKVGNVVRYALDEGIAI